MRALPRDRVAIESRDPGPRQQLADVLLHTLRTDSELADARARALRADGGHAPAPPPAAVAEEPPVGVQGEGDLARRTRHHVPAVAAEDHRRQPAPIEIQDRLLSLLDRLHERGPQRARERAAISRLQLEAEVHDRGRRERQVSDPLAEAEQGELALGRCVVRRDPRGGRAQHHRGTGEAAQRQGRVHRVIPRRALLLVGGLLLLVDDDETRPRQRSEEGGARANDEIAGPIDDAAPLVVPLTGGQRAVQHRHAIAEARDEAADDLDRECDLRHEDDDAEAPIERRLRRPQIHLGLAARRHAVQQEGTSSAQRADDRIERGTLRPRQRQIADGIVLVQRELGRYAADRAASGRDEPADGEGLRALTRPSGLGEIR